MKKCRQGLDKIENELERQYGFFWYQCRLVSIHTSVSKTILDQPEVIT